MPRQPVHSVALPNGIDVQVDAYIVGGDFSHCAVEYRGTIEGMLEAGAIDATMAADLADGRKKHCAKFDERGNKYHSSRIARSERLTIRRMFQAIEPACSLPGFSDLIDQALEIARADWERRLQRDAARAASAQLATLERAGATLH